MEIASSTTFSVGHDQAGRWRDDVHAQSRVAEQVHMDIMTRPVGVIKASANVILRHVRAEPKRLAQGHVVELPMGPASPGATEATGAIGQLGAHEIVLGIIIPKIAAEVHCENHLGGVGHEV